jgi:hypothetical protein
MTCKIIELLSEAKESMFLGSYYPAVELIEEALTRLKAPLRRETLEQWEKRTGEKYPDEAPVYEKRFFTKPLGATVWICHAYGFALRDKKKYPKRMTHNIILAADYRGPPPDGWMPEETE